MEATEQHSSGELCTGEFRAVDGPAFPTGRFPCKYFTGLAADSDLFIRNVWSGEGESLFLNLDCLPDLEDSECVPKTLYFDAPGSAPQSLIDAFPVLESKYNMGFRIHRAFQF